MQKATRARKFMLTIQASQIEAGWTHDKIKEALAQFKLQYWAMVNEIGNETHQLHTHVVLYRQTSGIRLSTIREIFPDIHCDVLRGTIEESRNYLLKTGKYAGTEKADTTVKNTFEEWGEIPLEPGRGHSSNLVRMQNLVKDGYTDLEILDAIPELTDKLTSIQRYRQLVIEENAREFRHMTVVYCYGVTGAGKTSGVYAQYKDNPGCICTINSYQGTGIFDSYDSSRCQVLLLDEFRNSLPISLTLALLDGQYQVINCRYSNRVATHTRVYIISNIPLLDQYRNIQQEEPETWKAFLRRINTVRHYYAVGKYHDYTVEEYLHAVRYGLLDKWESTPPEATPFAPQVASQQNKEKGEKQHEEGSNRF